jgi:DNA primase
MVLTPQWLDELRARTTLSALIGRSIKVTKAGREFKACCPFHNEKTPSFTINDEKGFYHCFGCSAHGDAIRWMTDQRGLSFMDAVKELADAAGMQVPAEDPKAAEKAERANSLYDVMAAAQNWFVAQFQGLEGAEARAYCDKRGLTAETLKVFGIGFAPDSRSKLKEALASYGTEKLVESGLLISIEDKEPYDRFRGRLMIPIRDPRGRVIAFGGRILGAGEPKYLNSPDTPLFDKGRTLYNLDKASPASRRTSRLVVVEGYMDVIALSQAGIDDVVAPLGTAVTENHIEALWRIVERPLLCFDGDEAGRKAANRAALRILPKLRPGFSAKFIDLPLGQDPDDFVKANRSKKVVSDFFSGGRSLAEQLWKLERQKFARSKTLGPDDRVKLRSNLESVVREIQDENISREYLKYLISQFFEEFGFKKSTVKKFGQTFETLLSARSTDQRDLTYRAVLLGLSRYPKVILKCIGDIAALPIKDALLCKMRSILIDAAIDSPEIEEDLIEQYWATSLGEKFAKRNNWQDLGFSFFKKHLDPFRPQNDLEMVINAITREYSVENEVSRHEAALDADGSDANMMAYAAAVEARRASEQATKDALEKAAAEYDTSLAEARAA